MFFFFFQAEDGIRDSSVTGVQTCALPILPRHRRCTRRGPSGAAPPGGAELRRAAARDHRRRDHRRGGGPGARGRAMTWGPWQALRRLSRGTAQTSQLDDDGPLLDDDLLRQIHLLDLASGEALTDWLMRDHQG